MTVGFKFSRDNVEDILRLGSEGTARKDRVQKARDALRKFYGRELELAYLTATVNLGVDANFSSPQHFIAGLVGLVNDVYFSLYGTVEAFERSKLGAKIIEGEYGKGGSLIDLVIEDMKTSDDIDMPLKAAKGLKKVYQHQFVGRDLLAKALADYCTRHKCAAERAVHSDKAMAEIAKKAYGSINKYERMERNRVDTLAKIAQDISGSLNKTLAIGVAGILRAASQEADLDLKSIGVNAYLIGDTIFDYISTGTRFLDAFAKEYKQATESRLRNYRAALR